MLKSLVEMMSGTDNKSAGKINVTLKCSDLKLEYEYEGPKRYTEEAVTEKCQFEFENFEISGECEATMSGFFKLICDIKDAVSSASSEYVKDNSSESGCIEGDYIQQLIDANKESIRVRTWPVAFKVLDGNEASACCGDLYNNDMPVVAFDCKRLYQFSDEDIVRCFLDADCHYHSNKEDLIRSIKKHYRNASGEIEPKYTTLRGAGKYDNIVIIVFE